MEIYWRSEKGKKLVKEFERLSPSERFEKFENIKTDLKSYIENMDDLACLVRELDLEQAKWIVENFEFTGVFDLDHISRVNKLLNYLDEKSCYKIYKKIKTSSISGIVNSSDLIDLVSFLNTKERKKIYKTFMGKIAKLITYPEDFSSFMYFCPRSLRGELYSKVKRKVFRMYIYNRSDIQDMVKWMPIVDKVIFLLKHHKD